MNEQLGLIDGKKFSDWPAWEGRGIPLPENCDLDNPRQRFLWMFTGMPGVKGAPMLMPTEFWETQSWRMCVLGAGIVGEPGLKYQPGSNMANAWTATGRWAPLDEPDPPRMTVEQVMDGLSHADRAEVKGYVLERMGLSGDIPDVPDGKYRVSDLAVRLNVPVDDLIRALSDFGLAVQPQSLVGREVADRIVFHLGLD